MAFTVMNNPSAMMSLGELNKNVSSLGKQLKKVASGTKITGADDGAAEFNIAERMQVQLRGLGQDIENTRTGRSMLKVAEGGIQGIVDELREMKQLAINAANDTNTDADRATIQKEFDEKLKQIDDIVATTHYNGKMLLNGNYERLHNSIMNENTDGINGSDKMGDTGATGGISTGVIEPNDSPTLISSGPYTITTAGVYVLGANYTGDISIADGLVGVKIKQATPAQLDNVHIIGPASGNANLWIEGLNVKNTTNQSFIRFSGSDNVLSIKGNNNITNISTYVSSALINIGDGLTIEGNASLEISSITPMGAMIGTDRNEVSNANLTINSGIYILTAPLSRDGNSGGGGAGALIGSGYCGSIGDITINGGVFDLYTSGAQAALGSGSSASAGDITIKNANITAVTDDGACIGSGIGTLYGPSSVGDINIENSVINVDCRTLNNNVAPDANGDGAGVGSGCSSGGHADAGDIAIKNSTVYASGDKGAGIGSGWRSHAGNIIIENINGRVTSKRGEAIGRGLYGTIGTISINGYVEISNKSDEISYQENISHGNPLIVHTGTKANQRINCYIENLGTKALFDVKTDKELEDLASVRTRASAQRLLGSLTDPSVEGPLDKAINYALNEMTQVGSYINRLEQTENTLTINHEITTSSESTIRDADMAKEMTEYTKSNVLAQAAQSMLAQANQNSSSVLSLLQ